MGTKISRIKGETFLLSNFIISHEKKSVKTSTHAYSPRSTPYNFIFYPGGIKI